MYLEIARTSAQQLRLLDPRGELVVLDSLMVVDYVQHLESASGLMIPSEYLQLETFGSLASVAALLERVASETQLAG